MTEYTSLPLESHKNRSLFLKHASNIGRAYHNQALELISICQLLSRIASPKCVHDDAELRRTFRVCDIALRSAAESGSKVTDEANARFHEATHELSIHSERRLYLDISLTVSSRMDIAKQKDSVESGGFHVVKRATKHKDNKGPTTTINFVLLRSPLPSSRDPDAVIVTQEFSTSPSLPEILWNFSRHEGGTRITLEQNPHFYLRLPKDESAYTPMFQCYPLQGPSAALAHNDMVYILLDGPGRVFLEAEHKLRIFCNVWSLNGSLIFRDRFGLLEGERLGLVRGSSVLDIGDLRYCEQQEAFHDSERRFRLNHRCLRPIVPTSSADCSTRSGEGILEDWTSLIHLTSRSAITHIYDSRGSPRSMNRLDLPPPTPTSERPEYPVQYTTINTIDYDTLFAIFNYYRLDEENAWNVHGWRKVSHVCRSWRHLVHSLAFHLGMHIQCTNGTPVVETLDHLPSFPLFIDYRDTNATISRQDELAIPHALRLCDRVHHIVLHIPPSILYNVLMFMGETFSMLKYLSLSSASREDTSLVLPKTCLAPNLRQLTLIGIDLPKRLRFLTSTVSLVTLVLTNIRASGYFRPGLLVARLQSLPQLEDLSIGFSIPIPRPSAERELLGKWGTPMTLPNLKHLRFRGVNAYLERMLGQIRAPLLEQLDITLFNQIVFSLPHLLYFTSTTEVLKPPIAEVTFGREAVSMIMDTHRTQQPSGRFALHVMCRQLDWQIDCAAQICSALMPSLSGVEELRLKFCGQEMPTEWKNGEIDGTTWHEFHRAFVGVKVLRLCAALSEELSRAFEVNDVGSDPGLLPGLQEIVSEIYSHDSDLFSLFIRARHIVGLPVTVTTRFRFRILSVGRSGVGKSSLINCVFGMNNATVPHFKPGKSTIDQEYVSQDNELFVLRDSQGSEPGDLSNFRIVRKFLEERSQQALPLKDRVHCIWLCVETPTAGGMVPVFETGDEELLKLVQKLSIPMVIVFTQYDRLVRTRRLELKDDYPNMDDHTLDSRSVKEAWKAFEKCLQSLRQALRRLNVQMPPYARISVRPGHHEDVSELMEVTRKTVKERLQSDPWFIIAQLERAKLPLKIGACITNVTSGYTRSLAGGSQKLLRDYLMEIHKDIVTCWNFKSKILYSEEFMQLMLHLVEDVIDGSQPQDLDPRKISQFVKFVTSNDELIAPPIAIIGLTSTFVQWLSTAVLINEAPVQRLVLAYTVDLIRILRELFGITLRANAERTRDWSDLKEAFEIYERSPSRRDIHKSICSYTPHDGRIFAANDLTNKLRELLNK